LKPIRERTRAASDLVPEADSVGSRSGGSAMGQDPDMSTTIR
jgi:hypothetical protein